MPPTSLQEAPQKNILAEYPCFVRHYAFQESVLAQEAHGSPLLQRENCFVCQLVSLYLCFRTYLSLSPGVFTMIRQIFTWIRHKVSLKSLLLSTGVCCLDLMMKMQCCCVLLANVDDLFIAPSKYFRECEGFFCHFNCYLNAVWSKFTAFNSQVLI